MSYGVYTNFSPRRSGHGAGLFQPCPLLLAGLLPDDRPAPREKMTSKMGLKSMFLQLLDNMVASAETKIRWAISDLAFFPDNDDRYEIIDGDLYVTRAPHWKHQRVVTRLCRALPAQDADHRRGEALTAPGLILAGEENAIPDLIWISQEKLAGCVDSAGHLTAAPELVVEVLSQSPQDIARDRQVKLKLYSRVGVREYWIIDWQQETVEIYQRSQGRLGLLSTLFAEDDLPSPLLPELSLKVGAIFA